MSEIKVKNIEIKNLERKQAQLVYFECDER